MSLCNTLVVLISEKGYVLSRVVPILDYIIGDNIILEEYGKSIGTLAERLWKLRRKGNGEYM